jgi:hypothetical protein
MLPASRRESLTTCLTRDAVRLYDALGFMPREVHLPPALPSVVRNMSPEASGRRKVKPLPT